ncbi:Copia protein [Golovinomyces cichoracearum]|uniref:Copia protein n=1 Tax=Golovinomyces cichoracearum TaxID=62708 RepID=A0A420J3J1_9PEZI|nr:Copia protein [Golovinomyces cichoracearum]
MGKASERAKLKSILNQVKPTVVSIKADLKAEYELLKVLPFGKSVNGYFSRWQILSIKCQTSTHSIFVTGEEDPSLALHQALQPIDPITATFRINKVNDYINAGREIIPSEEIKAWQSFLDSKPPSAANTPAQNGAAEVSVRVIVETARNLRVAASLPKNLWPWLCESAAYLLNRTTTKRLDYRTPYELATGKRPSVAHLHQIGYKAFALVHGIPKREKMEERVNIGYLLGCASTNIFYIWIPTVNKVIRTRDVVFKEDLHDSFKEITLGKLADKKNT